MALPLGEFVSGKTALETIDFTDLSERREQLAAELPLGSQRALAMTVALASRPRLLLRDQPFAGMNPEEIRNGERVVSAYLGGGQRY